MNRAGQPSSKEVPLNPAPDLMPHVLREYALLADGERGILVGPRGDFSWMCFPRWDSDALFSTLIGGGGSYVVCPTGRYVWGGYYEPGSLIWRSRWITDSGVVECREALALPPTSERAVVLRRITAERGACEVQIMLDLRSDFGHRRARELSRDDAGRWTCELGDGRRAVWVGGEKAKVEDCGVHGRRLALRLRLEPGQQHDLVLVLSGDSDAEPPPADWAWQSTEAAWSARIPALHTGVGERDARHAYAVLSGLTSQGGGMVAAATTSLPERAERGRNYDYRYVWIRDQALAGQAVAAAGPYPLLDGAVRFVRDRVLDDGPDLKPAYTTTGGRVPDQRQLKLPGYPGGADIVGNWVNQQFQLDALGEVLLLFAAAGARDRLQAEDWRAVEVAADAIARRWHGPDAGIWELTPKKWTHSRLICVAGLRAINRLGAARERAAEWSALADAILADTSKHALHPSGRWQRAFDDARVDAALLLPPIRGAVARDDPRTLATLEAVDRELTEEGYCYRYRPDERPLGRAEGAFLLCGFVMSLAWLQQGDRVRAARWFERNRAACGPPGLCSEEFDVRQRQLRGNLPQAFVHALLLECAVRQGREEEPGAPTR